jgi:pimeloyl-ACP methyl ester carboxylesterase
MSRTLSKQWHPALEAHVRESYRRSATTTRLDAFRAAARRESDQDDYMRVQERWIQPHLSTISLPTLLLWAADDATVGVERGVRLMQLMPSADLCVLRDAAHMVVWDRTATVGALLQGWLRHATATEADATAKRDTSV